MHIACTYRNHDTYAPPLKCPACNNEKAAPPGHENMTVREAVLIYPAHLQRCWELEDAKKESK